MIDRTTQEYKDKRKEVSRLWYENNKERKLTYMKEYWSNPKNLKKSCERNKKWRAEHKEEYNEYMRDYMRKKVIKRKAEETFTELTDKKTNQIIIKIQKGEDGHPLFEEIQNNKNLYDNMIIESNAKGETTQIIIEGKNINEIENLVKGLKEDYAHHIKELEIIKVPIEDTIIDEDKQDETGGMEV